MHTKKGMSELWWILATAAVVMVVVIIVLLWFKGGGEKGVGVITSQLDDDDSDGVKNAFDRCSETLAQAAVDDTGCSEDQRGILSSTT
ncbi:MAG: hypothetical protein Q8R53_02300 [Nanoarchaeota archaeon]|nr:hypothetical protein [Nanoarchaeota archaeon]